MTGFQEEPYRIVRHRDLEPQWHVPGAKEPGFIRYLISWVGGPKGYVNPNQGTAVISSNTVVGLMNLPVGQRQKGLHYHSVTEIYIILRGELEGWDGKGETHRAGPLDCIYIPKGVPHGVRNCGTEDCDLIWVHDGIEKIGTSTYFMDGVVPSSYVQPEDISVVRFRDLEASYAAHRAKEVGLMGWRINWVAGAVAAGFDNVNPEQAVVSDKCAIGMTVLPPAQKRPKHCHPDTAKIYLVLLGKALIDFGDGRGSQEIGELDGVYVRAGQFHGLRNHGRETLHILWVHERPQLAGSTQYSE